MTDLQAGREMDALVAEEVMGEVVAHAPIYDGVTRTNDFYDDTMEGAQAAILAAYPKSAKAGKLWPAQYCGPHYSTDIAAAWEVVEKLDRPVSVYRHADGSYTVRVGTWSYKGGGTEASAPTAPLAICRAALVEAS